MATAQLAQGSKRGQVVATATGSQLFWVEETYDGWEYNVQIWRRLDEAFQGGKDYNHSENLFKMVTELRSDPAKIAGQPVIENVSGQYGQRIKEGWLIPIVQEYLMTFLSFLKSKKAKRDKLLEIQNIEEFKQKCNKGRNETIDAFAIKVAQNLMVRGISYDAIDAKLTMQQLEQMYAEAGLKIRLNAQGRPILDQQIDKDFLMPYVYHIHPIKVRNGIHKDDGTFKEVILQERRPNGLPLETGKADTLLTYRHWTEAHWALYVVEQGADEKTRNLVLLDYGPNAFGIVPVFRSVYMERVTLAGDVNPWRGISLIDDWANVMRAIYNALNRLSWGLGGASDTQTYIFGELPATEDNYEYERAVSFLREMAASELMVLDTEAKIPPGTVNKKFEQGKLLLEMSMEMVRMMFVLVGMGDKVKDMPLIETEGGRTRSFQELNSKLGAFATILEDLERKIFQAYVDLLYGKGNKEIKTDMVEYPDTYDVRSVQDLLIVIEKVWGKAAPEFQKELIVDLMNKLFPEWPMEKRKEMEAAIQGHEDTEESDKKFENLMKGIEGKLKQPALLGGEALKKEKEKEKVT